MSHTFTPGTPGVHDIAIFKPFIESLPSEEEQHHSMVLLLNLQKLNGLVNEYASAVGLHTYAGQLRASVLTVNDRDSLDFNNNMHLLKNWDEMAGREASMIVFHVGKSLKQIKEILRFTPTIRADVDSTILRKASGDLEAAFPNYVTARHAAGHRIEAMASLDKMKEHGIAHGNGILFIPGDVQGDEYTATYAKKLLKVGLNDQSRLKLNSIVSNIYTAFPKLLPMLPPLNFGTAKQPTL